MEVSKKVRIPGKFWKYVSAQHSSDQSELHLRNRHFKSCLSVVWPTDLMKHAIRFFIRTHYDVVVSASFRCIYYSQITEKCLCFGIIPKWFEVIERVDMMHRNFFVFGLSEASGPILTSTLTDFKTCFRSICEVLELCPNREVHEDSFMDISAS